MRERGNGGARALPILQKWLRGVTDVFELSPGRARWLLALVLVAVTVLALSPPQSVTIDTGWDKLNHVLAFAALGFLALAASKRGAVVWPLLGVLGYGVTLELLQGLTPMRVASLADIVADALGLLSGWLLFRCWRFVGLRCAAVSCVVAEPVE